MSLSVTPLPPFSRPLEGYLHIADVFFWPFADTNTNRPTFLPSAEGRSTAIALFWEWVGDYSKVFPPSHELSPSPAAVRIFDIIDGYRDSALHLHIKPFSQGYCQLRVSVSRKSLENVGELVRPSDELRGLFWHVVQRQDPQMPLPSCDRDLCGFVGCAGRCLPVPSEQRVKFHLDHVFERCTRPSAVDDLGATPPRLQRNRLHAATRNALIAMPEEVLLKVVLLVSPRDRNELAAVGLEFAAFLAAIVPGLKTRLFPHQIHALSRVADLETRAPRNRPIPLLSRLEVRGLSTACVVVDLVDGSILRLNRMPFVSPPRGGLYCDEPGMGKTATALAMVLRTLGQIPEVPHGSQTFEEEEMPGLKWYHVKLPGRYCSYGDDLVQTKTRRSTLLPELEQRRSSLRRVNPPNYFQVGKGKGSLPDVHQGAYLEAVCLSRATLIVVPDVLTGHWRRQVRLNVQRRKLRLLHIRSAEDLPGTFPELVSFDIVLISFEVISRMYNEMREEAPMLLRIHFLRVIVDEGHFLSSANITRFGSVCNRIRAERRWVMTGTPTRSNLRVGVDHLHHLLRFIREESYGLDKRAWLVGIRDPYCRYQSESLDRLTSLLCDLMIRADKSMLSTQCEVRTVFIEFSKKSANMYNRIVEFVRRNLILSGWYDEHHCDSLLNPKNLSHAREVVSNLRTACCLEGTVDVTFSEEGVMHTLNLLYEKFRKRIGIETQARFEDPVILQTDSENQVATGNRMVRQAKLLKQLEDSGEKYLRLPTELHKGFRRTRTRRIYSGFLQYVGYSLLHGSNCVRCFEFSVMPLVTPCGHVLCSRCILLDRARCTAPNCSTEYEMDNRGHPHHLMQLQPAAISEGLWKLDFETCCSDKVSYLIERIENLAPDDATNRKGYEGHPKIIIHSQHVTHLRLVAMGLNRTRLVDCYAEMNMNPWEKESDVRQIQRASQYAQKSIQEFASNPRVCILLMNTRLGSVGLDLSFVEYIFLLEPVWDRAVERQVISRAHRIGAKGNVSVERLVMKDSIEHDMLKEMEANAENVGGAGIHIDDESAVSISRFSSLLRNLKPVRQMDCKRRLDSCGSEESQTKRTCFG